MTKSGAMLGCLKIIWGAYGHIFMCLKNNLGYRSTLVFAWAHMKFPN